MGLHTVCVVMTAEVSLFLKGKRQWICRHRGRNSVSWFETRRSLVPLCRAMLEAFEAGQAPKVILTATNEASLTVVTLRDLKRQSIDLA